MELKSRDTEHSYLILFVHDPLKPPNELEQNAGGTSGAFFVFTALASRGT
jgi:hypothetical protein